MPTDIFLRGIVKAELPRILAILQTDGYTVIPRSGPLSSQREAVVQLLRAPLDAELAMGVAQVVGSVEGRTRELVALESSQFIRFLRVARTVLHGLDAIEYRGMPGNGLTEFFDAMRGWIREAEAGLTEPRSDEIEICTHPQEERIGFKPATTEGHERCLKCGSIRYQLANGTWWPWKYRYEEQCAGEPVDDDTSV